jgi:hypothetical protein
MFIFSRTLNKQISSYIMTSKLFVLPNYKQSVGSVWNCSTNSTVEHLHKKQGLFWSTPLGSLTTPTFFMVQSLWSYTCLAEKCGAELKNMERNSPKHALNR